jgi:hypothetical protein
MCSFTRVGQGCGAGAEAGSLSARETSRKAEHGRHSEQINKVATPWETQQFIWKREMGGMESYQHIETGRHIHINGADSQFYDRARNPDQRRERA